MSKAFTSSVITGNELLSGEAVWRDPGGNWVPELRQAQVFVGQGAANAALAAANDDAARVVGAYLAAVELTASGPRPVHFRETFRTRGPSNYRHGKQEHV